jgi:hypothetical protein
MTKVVDLETLSVSELQALIADAKEQKRAKRASSGTKLRIVMTAFDKHIEAGMQDVKRLQALESKGSAVDWEHVTAQLARLSLDTVFETAKGMELVVRTRTRHKKVQVAEAEVEAGEPASDSKPKKVKASV